MRIISVRVKSVARVLAIVYSVFGLGAFIFYLVSEAEYLTLPFGVLAPLFHLNLNFNLARSHDVVYNILLCVAAMLSYAATGGITGAVVAFCFNAIAKQTGGIDAKHVLLTNDRAPTNSMLSSM
jgi:hypothetical protein